MTTTSQIDSAVRVIAFFAGAAPINAGGISFPTENAARRTIAGGAVRAHRILYADLTVSSTNRIYLVPFTNGALDDAKALNLQGELVDLSNDLSVAYIRTNTAVTITGGTPLPASLPANGEAYIAGAFTLDPAVVDAGDLILGLSWTQAALDAVGTGNFYCDLILA